MVRKKQLCSFSCVPLNAVGLALICGGTYLVSVQEELQCKVFIAWAIVFGLLAALVFTLFWTSYRVKRQLYKTVRQQHIQVYAITRPDSFPPCYQVSQCHGEQRTSAAPPLYSQDSSEAPGCTWGWEQPPPYSQTGWIQQQDAL